MLDRVKQLQKPAPPVAAQQPGAKQPATPQQVPLTTSYTLEGGTFVSTTGKRIREYEILEEIGQRRDEPGLSRQTRLSESGKGHQGHPPQHDRYGSADRFLREARILGELHHPNLVQLFEFGTLDNGAFFMVLELVRGESAAARVKRDGSIPLERALSVILKQPSFENSARSWNHPSRCFAGQLDFVEGCEWKRNHQGRGLRHCKGTC